MRARILGIALGVAGLFALWPVFAWLGAQFNWLDDRWFASLGSLAFTFPIALAVGAVVFAIHGMLLNAGVAEVLEKRFSEAATLPDGVVAAPEPVAVGATTGAPSGTAAAIAPPDTVPIAVEETPEAEQPAKLGGKMAVAERPKGFKDAKKSDKKSKKVGKVGKQVGQRWSYKAKGAARRGIRDRIGLRF